MPLTNNETIGGRAALCARVSTGRMGTIAILCALAIGLDYLLKNAVNIVKLWKEFAEYRASRKQLESASTDEKAAAPPNLLAEAAACAADAYARCERSPGERGDPLVFAQLDESLAAELKRDPVLWSAFARHLHEEAKLRGLSVIRWGGSFAMMRC